MKNKKILQLQEEAIRLHKFNHSLFLENKEFRQRIYEPLQRDEEIKKIAVEFGKKCIDFYKREGEYGSGLYRMNTTMAPGMLVESLEQIFDRFMVAKSGVI